MEGGEWGNTLPSQPSHLSHTFDSYLSFHVIKHCKSMIDKCLYRSVSFQLPTLTLVLPFHGSCTLSTPYSLGLLPLPWYPCFLIFFVSNRFCLILLRNGDLSFFAEGKLFPHVVSFKHPTCCGPNIWESGVSVASGKPLTLFARITSRLHTNNMAAHCSQDEQKQVSFV